MSQPELQTQAPSELGTRESLGELRQTLDISTERGAIKSFGKLLESDEGKKKFAALMGAVVGILVMMLNKKDEKAEAEEPKSDEEKTKLKEQIDEEMLLASDIQDIEPAVQEGAVNITGPEFEAVMDNRSLLPEEKSVRVEKMLEEKGTVVDFEDIRNDPSLNPSEKAKKVADKLKERGLVAANCFKFVEIVYILSGFKRKSIFDTARSYDGKYCGEKCAPPEVLDRLEPGDHIFINNRNEADDHGNHSVIFLGWADKGKYLGRVMGYYARKRSFHEFSVTLKGESDEKWAQMSDKEKRRINPVTQIIKPVTV